MTDKTNRAMTVPEKPLPMKLFATCDVDRTPPNCIPRLCSLTLTRLVLWKSIGPDIYSFVISVKMQGSKKTLRSNEIFLPQNGLLDTELQLIFSIQYPHFLKRDGNRLLVTLQRRKRYKNRAILGYKTLAEGTVNMSQVLQRQMDLELELYNDCKEEKGHSRTALGKIYVSNLSSQPVDLKENSKVCVRSGEYSDEEEDYSSDAEADGSDSETMIDDRRPSQNGKLNESQRNIKQRFISLLKRFRVTEDLQLDSAQDVISRKLSEAGEIDGVDIEDLFDELEDLSDSGPEMDTMSISSTPKPSLRPFFSSCRSLLIDEHNPGHYLHKKGSKAMSAMASMRSNRPDSLLERVSDEGSKKADSDSHAENWTDSDPPPPNSSPPYVDKKESTGKERKSRLFSRDWNNSSGGKGKKKDNPEILIRTPSSNTLLPKQLNVDPSQAEARKSIFDELSKLLPPEEGVPHVVCLVDVMSDSSAVRLKNTLRDKLYKVIQLTNSADLKSTLAFLINKMQKICTSTPKPIPQVKLLLAGPDTFIHSVVKHYVDRLSFKSFDWATNVKFYTIPFGTSNLCRYLGSIDATYSSLFLSESWKVSLESGDTEEIAERVEKYLQHAGSYVNLPVAEAMLTRKDKSTSEESFQIFVPFITEVRLGNVSDSVIVSLGNVISEAQMVEEGGTNNNLTNTSTPPPNERKFERMNTPPNSPNVNCSTAIQRRECGEWLDLQVDYWSVASTTKMGDVKAETPMRKCESGKMSIKGTFRTLQISRLPMGEFPESHFTINYATKDKKQKIMRIGKKKEKERDVELKNQTIEKVARMICSPRSQNVSMTVNIDGKEWSDVKFFQLSAQWQSHIKNFPISLFETPSMDNGNG